MKQTKEELLSHGTAYATSHQSSSDDACPDAPLNGPAPVIPAVIVPKFLAPNYLKRPYIHSGYRVGGTHISAIRSLFSWHNETLNAWTMILGSFMSTFLFLSFLLTSPLADKEFNSHVNVDNPLDALTTASSLFHSLFSKPGTGPFITLWLAALTHMPFSVSLHLYIGISERARNVNRTLDIFFIQLNSVLLAGAFGWPVFNTGMWFIFILLVVLVFLANIYSTMIKRKIWQIPKKRTAVDVGIMVLCYCAPLMAQTFIDLVYYPGSKIPYISMCVFFYVSMAGILYGAHLPERLFPGKLDLIGNSHQLMHVCAYAAHYYEWIFLFEMYKRM